REVLDQDELVDLRDERRQRLAQLPCVTVRYDDRGDARQRPSTSRYAAAARRAVSSHEKSRTRSSPARTRVSRSASARRTASASAPGSAYTAASPPTARSAGSFVATTGVPHAIASSTGSPKPS